MKKALSIPVVFVKMLVTLDIQAPPEKAFGSQKRTSWQGIWIAWMSRVRKCGVSRFLSSQFSLKPVRITSLWIGVIRFGCITKWCESDRVHWCESDRLRWYRLFRFGTSTRWTADEIGILRFRTSGCRFPPSKVRMMWFRTRIDLGIAKCVDAMQVWSPLWRRFQSFKKATKCFFPYILTATSHGHKNAIFAGNRFSCFCWSCLLNLSEVKLQNRDL